MTRKIVLNLFPLVILVSLLTVAPRARAADQPLTQDDVTLLLLGGATTEKVIALIEQRGIDFQMNPDLAKKFHDAGASDEVVEALQKAGAKARPNAPATSQSTQPAREQSQASTGGAVEGKIAETLAGVASRPNVQDHPFAPRFSLVDLWGEKLDLADYKGRVVLLDFWATWCAPCRAVIPDFVDFQNRYRDRGFQVIGVAVDDVPKRVKKFYDQNNMNYLVAMCDSTTRQLYGGIHGLPTTYLIGRDGRVYAQVVGAPADAAVFEERIKALLALTPREGTGKVEQAAKSSPVAVTTVAESSPPSKAGFGTPSSLTDPAPDQVQRIVQEFAAKEKLFRQARNNYTYHQINKVQELGPDGEVEGVYEQEWDILYDDSGKRIERVTYAPVDTLKRIGVTQEDLSAMRNIQPFVMTSDELAEYDIKYLGHVKVDEITAYVFSIRPKEIQKGRQYFQGVVWVDDRDLQIVKSEGKSVPEMKTKRGENLFPRFTTYREQIDGKFWFPTYTMADDTLYFSGGPVHIKQIIRYTEYKQFKASSTVKVVTELPSSTPEKPSKPSSPK